MNLTLDTHWESFIRERIESGRYRSADEVVLDGLRLLKEREAERQLRLEELRRSVAERIAQLDRGDYIELDDEGLAAYLEDVERRGLERTRLADEREAWRQKRLEELRGELMKGVEELDRGDYIELDEEGLHAFMDDIMKRGRERLAKATARE